MKIVHTRAKAAFVAAFILLAGLGSAGLQIWADYRETLEQQEATTRDIARVVEAQVHSTINQTEAMLGLLAAMIEADRGLARMREPSRWEMLHAYCDALSGCKSLAVLDPRGRIVALSDTRDAPNIDVSDRAYFREARQAEKLFIGPAVKTRIPGNPILFGISRPVFDKSGKLLAVLCAGMATAHLTDFYGLMGFNLAPTVTVFKGNGDLVARNPDMDRFVGKNFVDGPLFTEQLPTGPGGVYRSVSVFDGKARIASYRAIADFDIVVFAGIDVQTAFRRWRGRAWRTGVTSAAALAVILLTLYSVYHAFRRELNLASRNQELDRLSNTDALTGIANRRFFEVALEREWARHRAENKPLSLLMIDVDCFKLFNDCYGHQAGDDCLRQVAGALQKALLRNVDIVARYGGEEFAVILDADRAGALAVGERMRAAVEALALPHAKSSAAPVVTISVGAASVATGKTGSLAELVGAADAALYTAKKEGRNRVAAHGTPAQKG